MANPESYKAVRDVLATTIRNLEGSGIIFSPYTADRVAMKCAPFFYPIDGNGSFVDRLEAAIELEIIYDARKGINRLEEYCGGPKVLVGWQEWGLWREEMR